MTTTFFAPPDAFQGERIVLPDDEARHAVRVLRKRAGDEIIVVDGTGGWHRVRLDRVGEDRAVGTVLEMRRNVGESAYRLTIAFGLIKSRNRFETFVEKAVELGVYAIVPLHTARTERQSVKRARTRNVMIAAMKQCGRCRLPALAEPTSLPALLNDNVADHTLIAHEQVEVPSSIPVALADVSSTAHICVLIGPEGGFTEEEVEQVIAAGGVPVSLGPRRLRAETAGIAAAVAVGQVLAVVDFPHSL